MNKSNIILKDIKDTDSLKTNKDNVFCIIQLMFEFKDLFEKTSIGSILRNPIRNEIKTLTRIKDILNSEINRIQNSHEES